MRERFFFILLSLQYTFNNKTFPGRTNVQAIYFCQLINYYYNINTYINSEQYYFSF